MKNLAPIILFSYNRPLHTEQVLQALKKNELANESILYIFVDGPRIDATEEQRNRIDQVCEVVKKEQWCSEVFYYISKTNIGCRNSILAGITKIINQYGKAIILEDDIYTSPQFLKFMNEALDFYENRKSVFSISGYNLPEHKLKIPDDYKYDVYVSLRLWNWGWATWKDRWEQVDWNYDFVPQFVHQKEQVEAFNRGGDDLIQMLIDMYSHRIDAWDIQYAFAHFQNHAIAIMPCKSYVENIGLDGSGIHCGITKDFKTNVNFASKEAHFIDILYEDKRIINSLSSVFCKKKRPLIKKIINRLSRILLGRNIFIIKKKVFA